VSQVRGWPSCSGRLQSACCTCWYASPKPHKRRRVGESVSDDKIYYVLFNEGFFCLGSISESTYGIRNGLEQNGHLGGWASGIYLSGNGTWHSGIATQHAANGVIWTNYWGSTCVRCLWALWSSWFMESLAQFG
jgi:hypothetical protein